MSGSIEERLAAARRAIAEGIVADLYAAGRVAARTAESVGRYTVAQQQRAAEAARQFVKTIGELEAER